MNSKYFPKVNHRCVECNAPRVEAFIDEHEGKRICICGSNKWRMIK